MPSNTPLSLKDIFVNLKTSILGVKTDKIDDQVDSAIKRLSSYGNIHGNKYIEAVKSLVSTTGEPIDDSLIKDINQSGVNGVSSFEQSDRLKRYGEYDSIVSNISYCQRALKVLADNIISPDDITKRTIQVVTRHDAKEDKNNISSIISKCQGIISDLNIESIVDKLVLCTLKKGDYFVEIINSPKGQNVYSIVTESANIVNNTTLTETVIYNNKQEKKKKEKEKKISLYEYDMFGGVKTFAPTSDVTQSSNGTPSANNTDKFKSKADINNASGKTDGDKCELNNMYIVLHDPKHVIRLETERFRTCLGYLVFPPVDTLMFQKSTGYNVNPNSVDNICVNILKNIEKNLSIKSDTLTLDSDLKTYIKKYISDVKSGDDIKIRYVKPEYMCHWRINVDKFDPYGESIFECVKFNCKIFMALETSMTIKRLTSATDKRLIKVETGLPRGAKNLIETMKENFRKRKISIDQFGSVDTIPSHISTFEDIYIPTRDGKEFVSVDSISFGPDPQQDIEPLKFMRDTIVANLMVPPSFVGLEENVSNRSSLTVESIQFARTVIAYQREFSLLLKSLISKIYTLVYDKDNALDKLEITFPPPKASNFEHINEYMSQLSTLIESCNQLGIPKQIIKKKYLPDIDWDEAEKVTAEENIDRDLNLNKSTDEMNGGFGGGIAPMGGGIDMGGGLGV